MTRLCDRLLHGIHFSQEQIRACCSTFKGAVFSQNPNGCDIDEIINARNTMLTNLKNGIVPNGCKGCFELKDGEFSENTKISTVHFNHYLQCNSMCVHCNNTDYEHIFVNKPQKSGFYDVMPYLQNLDEQGLFDEFVNVFVAGGEPTCLAELDDILDFFDKKHSFVVLFSSGILFNQKIADLMSKNKLRLVISLDCGDSKTFKKIKRVDKFDEVVKNISKYSEFNSKEDNTYSCINLKYVMLAGLNDKKEQIDKFFEVAKNSCVTDVQIDFDNSNKVLGKKLPDKQIELFKYFVEQAKILGFRSEITSRVENCVEKGLYI